MPPTLLPVPLRGSKRCSSARQVRRERVGAHALRRGVLAQAVGGVHKDFLLVEQAQLTPLGVGQRGPERASLVAL
jgi:hypothetical protein